MIWHKRTFRTYSEALSACDGYEAADLVAVVVAKTKAYVPPYDLTAAQAFSLGALSAASGNPIRVLDFGGAAGAHYKLARHILPATKRLDWLVVETPEMVAQASPLSSDELRFSTYPDMQDADLLHLSGVLQSLPDPMQTLAALLATRPRQVIICRMSLGGGEVTIQRSRLKDNGPGPLPSGVKDREVRYPHTSLRMDAILQAMAGYDTLATFEGGILTRRTFRTK
jgi:putative methyltransferase (TIGR04325 family)